MNTPISLDQARQLINPSVPLIVESLHQVVSDWNNSPPNYHAAMDASARKQIVNKFTYHHAALGGIPYLEDQLQRYWLFDLVVVRVKHLNSQLAGSNYPTRRAKEWNQQSPLPSIPFGRLNFGYRTDITGTIIKDAFITLPNGDSRLVNDWVWQVEGESINAFPVLRNMFGDEIFRYEAV